MPMLHSLSSLARRGPTLSSLATVFRQLSHHVPHKAFDSVEAPPKPSTKLPSATMLLDFSTQASLVQSCVRAHARACV